MKNTSASVNTRRNPPQNEMRYATHCMTQSTFQKKILSLVQRAGDKVAEAMNIVDEVGAIAGINVHFERGGLSELAELSEQDNHQGKHLKHSDDNLGGHCDSRYNHSNRINENCEADDVDDLDGFDEIKIKEVTIPDLAEMISERTCFKPECTLCVLNMALDLMQEQNLILDLGTISAEDTDNAYDCDNCHNCDDCDDNNNECDSDVMNQRTKRTGGDDQ